MKVEILNEKKRSMEEWKEIHRYEGLYSVSNQGNVKSHIKKSGFFTS